MDLSWKIKQICLLICGLVFFSQCTLFGLGSDKTSISNPDSIINELDLCPDGISFVSDENTDLDRDGCRDSDEDKCVGNAVSNEDGDGDGLCGELSATNPSGDNCPLLSNPSQEDYDRDGLGDVCDSNIDNDHVYEGGSEGIDLCEKSPLNYLATDDADNDGCEDGLGNEDKCGGIDGNAVSNEDGDYDGLCGELSATNTKGDSCPSLSNNGTNDHADPDGDYHGNACDDDDDNDNVVDSTDIDDDGDGLIELDNDVATANPGSIKNMYRKNDGSHYNDGSGGITTGCGGLNSITACKGYELVSDVTISSSWNTTVPGPNHNDGNRFSAIFDGNGHSIIINGNITSATTYVGLFGYVSGVLKNFTLRSKEGSNHSFSKSVDSGARRMGTVAGVLKGDSNTEHAMIDRVYVVNVNLLDSQSNDTSYNRIGGLVGYLEQYVAVTNSYTNANIMLSTSGTAGYRVGGFVGDLGGGVSIHNSYATGDIDIASTVSLTGINNQFGGLIGNLNSATNVLVSNCYATGNITATTNLTNATDKVYLGGLIANSNKASVSYSYATGNITNTGNSIGNRYGGQLTYAVGGRTVATNNYYNVESDFPDTTIVALGEAHSGMYGYTDAELKLPTAPDYSFTGGVPSTDTSTELRCIARNGTWTTDTCTGATASGSYTLYTDWSTDNWDFGTSSQLPALKFTDSDELIQGQTR